MFTLAQRVMQVELIRVYSLRNWFTVTCLDVVELFALDARMVVVEAVVALSTDRRTSVLRHRRGQYRLGMRQLCPRNLKLYHQSNNYSSRPPLQQRYLSLHLLTSSKSLDLRLSLPHKCCLQRKRSPWPNLHASDSPKANR